MSVIGSYPSIPATQASTRSCWRTLWLKGGYRCLDFGALAERSVVVISGGVAWR